MAVEIPKDAKERLIAPVKRFATDEPESRSNSRAVQPRAERPRIGDLKASLLLDFTLKETGPSTCSQAVADAKGRAADTGEPESEYWRKQSGNRERGMRTTG